MCVFQDVGLWLGLGGGGEVVGGCGDGFFGGVEERGDHAEDAVERGSIAKGWW